MLGNWAKATTSTTGTGNLTLAAVSGFPAFSDVFPLNQLFSYVILDSNNEPREAGVGYLSGSTTLVRAKVHATWNGTTYTKTAASAVSLTGTSKLIATPIASAHGASLINVDAVSASVNRWITASNRNVATTNIAPNANRMYYVPFKLDQGMVLESFSVNVTTAGGAGSKIRVGIYACLPSGYPGERIASTGDLASDSTGVKTETLGSAVYLQPGWYFTGSCATGGTFTCYGTNAANFAGQGPFGYSGVTAIEYRHETLTVGWTDIPTTPDISTTASAAGGGAQPIVYLGGAW